MSIILEQLTKRYGGHPVVNNVSLEIKDGEFFVLLGSSGSGKTTILNMIAGLAEIDQGRVLLHGRDVTHLPPQKRQVGLVFQHYALFQHMSVAHNIEFGLRVRKVAAAERQRRRDELLELVGLTGLGNRMPSQISGGQQQRVALARALAHQPDVLLLDEPLGALDAKIRAELRRTLHGIQRELGITTILVTHDQDEAFELADRVGVMNFGRLLEVGSPAELYRHPQTEFVASFLGTANLLVGQHAPDGVRVGSVYFPLNGQDQGSMVEDSGRMQVLFRPEDVVLASSSEALNCPQLGQAEVEQNIFAGSSERLRLRLPPIPGVRPIAPPVSFGNSAIVVEAARSQEQINGLALQPGQKVWVGVRRIHALAHPGLNFLMLSDGSTLAAAALNLGGQLARLAHARTTLLGYGLKGEALQKHLREAKEQLGSGLASLEVRATEAPLAEAIAREAEKQVYDLVVFGFERQASVDLVEQILQTGEHNLLLVTRSQQAIARALICVATGEPGKEDISFAGRLIRHIGAEATLLSVLPPEGRAAAKSRTERFLVNGIRTLNLLGVPAQPVIRVGSVRDEIIDEMTTAGHDLLVLGTPLKQRSSQVSINGVVGHILNVINRPVLIIRSDKEVNQ